MTTTEDDLRVARFRIVVFSRRWDRKNSTWVNGEPTYVAVACWRRLADNVASSLRRGDPVVVTGRLKVFSVGAMAGRRPGWRSTRRVSA